MAKISSAKAKKLRGEAQRAAAARRAEKAEARCPVTRGEVDLDAYAELDNEWREIGLAAPARRALVDAGLLKVTDLRKENIEDIKALHGMGPNAIRILISEMKKRDISFRK